MLKIGDKVQDKQLKFIGTIVAIDLWEDSGPLSIENHGALDIKVTSCGTTTYPRVGDTEHYVYFGWNKVLNFIGE